LLHAIGCPAFAVDPYIRIVRTYVVHVIAMKPLKQFWMKHADAETPLRSWYKVTSRATWKTLAEVRKVYPHADPVGSLTVFNIGGRKYRLVVVIDYSKGKVFVRNILTHTEYDRGKWKKE